MAQLNAVNINPRCLFIQHPKKHSLVKMISTHVMSARSIVGVVVAVPAIFALKHAWEVYDQIRVVDRRRIHSNNGISDAYCQSSTIKDIVNPRTHVSTSDSRYVDLTLPKNASRVTDERILAAFTHGFFGGKVFAPERIALAAIGRDFTGFEGESGYFVFRV